MKAKAKVYSAIALSCGHSEDQETWKGRVVKLFITIKQNPTSKKNRKVFH